MSLSRKWAFTGLGSAALSIVAVALYAQSGSSLAGRNALPLNSVAVSSGAVLRPQLTRLQVDLFELRCGPDDLLKLDLLELGQSESGLMRARPEEILGRLRQLGEAKLLVRYDNFVDITSGTQLTSGVSVPTVRDIATTGTGLIVPTVDYDRLGFVVDLKGSWLEESERDLAFIDFNLESSGLGPDTVDVGSAGKDSRIHLPVYERFQSSQRLVARQGVPVLLACTDLSKQHEAPAGQKTPVLIGRIVATRLIE